MEIASSIASLIFAIFEFVVVLSIHMKSEVIRPEIDLNFVLSNLAYQILPVLLMFVGSFLHSFRKSWVGLVAVILFGLVTILMKALTFFLINTIFDYGLFVSLVVFLSGVLAIQTIIFAICARKFDS